MRKMLILFFIIFYSTFNLHTQTCGSSFLCTQAEVDNLNCSVISGIFYLGHSNPGVCGGATDINSLNNLSQITTIKDAFGVVNNPNITSLSGMGNVNSIGDNGDDNMIFVDNTSLMSIGVLDGVNSFKIKYLSFSNNGFITLRLPNNLTSLTGSGGGIGIMNESTMSSLDFNNLNSSNGNITIRNCPALTSITAPLLSSLNNYGILMDNLPMLTSADFNGLNSNVGYIVLVNDNSSLTSVNFTGVTALVGNESGYSLDINNTALSNMNGFSGLQSLARRMRITNNASLSTLDGLDNITSINDFIVIQNNPNLNDCCAIWDLIDNGGINGSINISANGANCSSVAAIQAACAPMPVNLIDFEATSFSQHIQLDWTTAEESNNAGFDVERSLDGKKWHTIDFIQGAGSTNESSQYRYADLSPKAGMNYYRLKQIDLDGKFEYTKVVTAKYGQASPSIQLFPNPSDRWIKLQISNPLSQKMKIKISDKLGRTIWQSEWIEGQLEWRKEMKIDKDGVYFLTAQIGKDVFHERIIISNAH